MSIRNISTWLFLLGVLYLILAINTLLGILFSVKDLMMGIVILVNGSIYLFGLLERREDAKKRASHLLVGSFFSYTLSIYQIVVVFSLWLEGFIGGVCLLSVDVINFPLLFSGLLISFVSDYVKKSFTTT
ncbi:MAG: hypothetical protein KBI09_02770 [Mesotoga sp.]|jgi:hypothetical protein|uniref:Uncharacterized protein n=1 Tax=Mesotoga infera TaxID=1236046 RepID=A0A7Z7LGL0_9BACT|nr:hypothetical protein [Mesotoga infera]MBP8659834.1 hypothetical protein [Mesotoga sp.]SSC13366.1 conserved membrane protein of unknown function [Mesotoga infera]